MARTVEEIRELKEYCELDLYSQTRKEQKTDLEYINDTFKTGVTDPHMEFRSGLGREIVDSPAEQIITSNPQVTVKMLRDSARADETGKRISKVVNQLWVPILRRQTPNPFKEYVKNENGRGESYYKIIHNINWIDDDGNQNGLPFKLIVPDPMVIYGSPEEDDDGVPEWVIVYYERQLKELIPLYPYLEKLRDADNPRKLIKWLEYWDGKSKYCEADGEPITAGLEPNPYKRTPFVRKYSGFGRRSPDGELSNLIVSDLRFQRDRIREECMLHSDWASVQHIYAHPPITIIVKGQKLEITKEELREGFALGAYDVNVLDNLPQDTEIKWGEDRHAPTREMSERLQQVQMDIFRRNPFVTSGFPSGSSGRHEDVVASAAMRRYDTVIENTENAVAVAFEFGLRNICGNLPDWKPKGLNKGDLGADFQLRVELKAPDPIEEDRLSLMGRSMVQMGQLSLRTNLIRFQGYTADEADEEIDEILAERYMFQSPDIAELMQLRAAEKSGMIEDIQAVKARRAELEQKIKEFPLGAQFGSQGGEPRIGNVKSPTGFEGAGYQGGQRSPREA